MSAPSTQPDLTESEEAGSVESDLKRLAEKLINSITSDRLELNRLEKRVKTNEQLIAILNET